MSENSLQYLFTNGNVLCLTLGYTKMWGVLVKVTSHSDESRSFEIRTEDCLDETCYHLVCLRCVAFGCWVADPSCMGLQLAQI